MGIHHRKQISITILLLAAFLLVTTRCSMPGWDLSAPDPNLPQDESTPAMILATASQAKGIPNQGKAWLEDGCNFDQFNPRTDFEIVQRPRLDEPAARLPFHDPLFGTCLVRVTDRAADLAADDPSKGMKNEYSRVQSFNADSSLLVVFTTEGNWYLYDAISLAPLGQLPIGIEPRWDAQDPDMLYYTDETRLMAYRVTNGEQWIVHEFADDFPGQPLAAVWTKYEGSPSLDSRYWGLMASNPDWLTVAFLIYDLETDQVIAKRATPPSEIDSVAISPLDDYFLAFYDDYCEHGQLGSEDEPCGLMVYDRNLENGRGLLRIVGHSDVALDGSGKEVFIYQDIDTDEIALLDLASGEITPLLPIDFSHSALGFHFSGQAYHRPGWALVSTSNGTQPSSTWMDDLIFALELKPGGRVVRLAHTYSVYDEGIEHDYWAEPHASVNRDFTLVVFTSNWGRSGTEAVDMYMLKLPADWMVENP